MSIKDSNTAKFRLEETGTPQRQNNIHLISQINVDPGKLYLSIKKELSQNGFFVLVYIQCLEVGLLPFKAIRLISDADYLFPSIKVSAINRDQNQDGERFVVEISITTNLFDKPNIKDEIESGKVKRVGFKLKQVTQSGRQDTLKKLYKLHLEKKDKFLYFEKYYDGNLLTYRATFNELDIGIVPSEYVHYLHDTDYTFHFDNVHIDYFISEYGEPIFYARVFIILRLIQNPPLPAYLKDNGRTFLKKLEKTKKAKADAEKTKRKKALILRFCPLILLFLVTISIVLSLILQSTFGWETEAIAFTSIMGIIISIITTIIIYYKCKY